MLNPFKVLNKMPLPVKTIIFGTFINRFGGLVGPLLALILIQKLKLSEHSAGQFIFVFSVGTIIAIILGGWLSDLFGRKHTMIASLCLAGILATLAGFCDKIQFLLPLLFLFGFFSELFRPASTAILADLLPSNDRSVGFAAYRMAYNLGYTSAVLMGGFFLDLHFDWNWRLLFWFDGTTTLLFGLLILIVFKDIKTTHPTKEDTKSFSLKFIYRDKIFAFTTLAFGLHCLTYFSIYNIFPLTVTQGFGYSNKFLGFLLGLNGLLCGFFEVTIVNHLKNHRRMFLTFIGYTVFGIGVAITGLVPHWSWLILCVLLWTIGEIISAPLLMAFITDWSPPHLHGQYLSISQASVSAARALNPILFFPIHSYFNEWQFWMIASTPMIYSIAWVYYLEKSVDKKELLKGAS